MNPDHFGRTDELILSTLAHEQAHVWQRTDEAAMIDSRNLARLTRPVHGAGAKLILTGDDRQLASIAAGD